MRNFHENWRPLRQNFQSTFYICHEYDRKTSFWSRPFQVLNVHTYVKQNTAINELQESSLPLEKTMIIAVYIHEAN